MVASYRNCMWTGYDCMGKEESNWSAWPYTIIVKSHNIMMIATLSFAVTMQYIIIFKTKILNLKRNRD